MTFQAGDRVVAESVSTERPARYGTVREVVREDPRARYRIEWDDGRTSVSPPAAAALRLAPERQAGGVTTGRRCRAQRLRARVRSRRPADRCRARGCATRSRWG